MLGLGAAFPGKQENEKGMPVSGRVCRLEETLQPFAAGKQAHTSPRTPQHFAGSDPDL